MTRQPKDSDDGKLVAAYFLANLLAAALREE
jgi:hypothetical protein